jgi:hypothetical protein
MGCGLFALAVEAQAVWSIITLVGRVLAAKVSRNPEPVVGTEVLEQARYDFVAGPIRRPFSETLAMASQVRSAKASRRASTCPKRPRTVADSDSTRSVSVSSRVSSLSASPLGIVTLSFTASSLVSRLLSLPVSHSLEADGTQ